MIINAFGRRAPWLAAIAAALTLAASHGALADRTLESLAGFDLPGGDYRTLRSVPLEECESVCLADTACAAFTYNERARWCFLKSSAGERVAYPGATSAIVRESTSVDALPLPDIAFLPGSIVADAARLEAQISAVNRTMRQVGVITPALAGPAAAQRSDTYLDLARSLRAASFEDYSDRMDAQAMAGAAAYLGLKTATAPLQQGRALALLSRVMESQGLFRPAIESSAASLAFAPDAAEAARLETLRAEHGFRVLDYEVDSESLSPRLCVQFSEPLSGDAVALQRFVTLDGASDPTLSVENQQLCVEGLTHGERYIVSLRAGVPSTVGETLRQPSEFRAYVRDRAPIARFETNRYVLPAAAEGIPVTSVNTDELELALYRVNDRNIADVVRRDEFKRALYPWEVSDIADDRGALVWEGRLTTASERNTEVRTLIPLGEVLPRTEPGVYVMTATPAELADRSNQTATQWFIVSDLGLSTFSSGPTVDVFVRSLASAGARAGVEVALLARNDEVLATAVTDAEGHARLTSTAPVSGSQAPTLVTASDGEDYAFLSLVGGAFELTDRGVAGRTAPGPIDAFLATERGVYRGGETVHLTALLRDDTARALSLPLTIRLERPDGVVSRAITTRADDAGGTALAMDLTANAATGTWTVSAHVDPNGPAVGQTTFLVEDYVPQRIAVDITSDATEAVAGETLTADLSAKFLYGAPAADLVTEGTLIVRPATGIAGFEGYQFGLVQEPFTPTRTPLFDMPRTGADGSASLTVPVPDMADVSAALEARIVVNVREPGGRQVGDGLTLPIRAERPLIGIKPKFADGMVAEGTRAGFDIIALAPDRSRVGTEAEWVLTRIHRNFQWYRRDGRWFYDSSERLEEVASGTVSIGTEMPAAISVPVEWGRYRLEVVDAADPLVASSTAFNAGWVSDTAAADTPDILEVHLDRESYAAGDTATLRIVPRFAGTALVTVLTGSVQHSEIVDVPAGGAEVALTVAEDWGPGAYVAATLFRPAEPTAGGAPLPQRAVGIAHMAVGTEARTLDVTIGAPAATHPRQTLDVPLTLAGLAPGESAYVTLAAVDVGILNITGYTPPDAVGHFLGQRRLGVELRDLYGDLIDSSGAMRGRVRSGGDGPGSGTESLPLAEAPVALFTGVLTAGPDGRVNASLDIPSFNGTLKLMAVAWTAEKVGNAAADMVVRDPVVVAGTLPRFLAPGDTTRMRIDLHNVAHVAGDYRLNIMSGGPIVLDRQPSTLRLDVGERSAVEIPLSATGTGEATIIAQLDGPDGLSIDKDYVITVRPAAAEVRERRLSVLSPGESLTLGDDLLAPFDADAELTLSAGNGNLDVAGLLTMLDRFPYGCSEQTVSRALPLLYVNEVARSIGMEEDAALPDRIRQSISRVLANQSSSGGFGLWSPGYDLWLTAYVMDFLTRAEEAGYDVPEIAFQSGLDRLQSVLSYVSEIEGERGTDIAYATYVLARNGRAAIGDVRYFAEERLDDFPAPMARAQLAASLALAGDDALAERLFETAVPDNISLVRPDRTDYGTPLRDAAAIVALAAEARVAQPVMTRLEAELDALKAATNRTFSTQEAAWLLLGAEALRSERHGITVAGTPEETPFSRAVGAADLGTGLIITNSDTTPLAVATTVAGTPLTPQPPVSAGLTVERAFLSLDGEPVEVATVAQNTRLVVSLTVTKTVADAMRIMLTDLLPAGFEIENPRLVAEGDIAAVPLARIGQAPEHTEFRDDRFAAAWDLGRGNENAPITVSYVVRAVTPGTFTLPAPEVSAIYEPAFVARGAAGSVTVVPTR
ncbi:large extracellular alpha-helical protein [Stappia sp. 22II-S9-Z10]|nr:large extracellular alpha-helical protein [Stappia sp. 22II-S9-Z10]